jgi:hypothetical protein
MKSQFRSDPPERLIESTGDGLKSFRTLIERYIKAGDTESASRVAALTGDAAVDQTEVIIGE